MFSRSGSGGRGDGDAMIVWLIDNWLWVSWFAAGLAYWLFDGLVSRRLDFWVHYLFLPFAVLCGPVSWVVFLFVAAYQADEQRDLERLLR